MSRTASHLGPALAIAAAAAMAVAGCGAITTASNSSSNATGGAPAIDVSAVKSAVTSQSAVPSFTAPGPAFDASKARGKTIFNIPLNSTIPFNQIIDQASAVAAKAAGANFVEYSNQGQPSQWIQGINTAIGQKADLIILEGSPDPKLLGPQIAAAKAAGIPVVSTHLYDESYAATALQENSALSGIVPANHYKAGTLMADYAILNSGGHVDAYFVTSNEVQPSAGIAQAFVDELKKQCPSTCKGQVDNIPVTDWANKVPTAVQSALIKDPNVNFVVPVYDGMTPFISTGIISSGAQNRVKIVAYNGTASVLQMVQQKNLVVADIGEPLEWLGWANIDQALRVLAGTPPLTSEKTPLRLFDSQNVNDAGNPANQTGGYGSSDAFTTGYKHLWGLS